MQLNFITLSLCKTYDVLYSVNAPFKRNPLFIYKIDVLFLERELNWVLAGRL